MIDKKECTQAFRINLRVLFSALILSALVACTNTDAVDNPGADGSTSRSNAVDVEALANEALLPLQGCPAYTERVEINDTNAASDVIATCSIEGDLYISGDGVTGASLVVLRNVHHVQGSVFISDSLVDDLSHLSRLETIDGDLVIDNNRALSTTEGLSGLKHIGHDLIVRRNDSMRNMKLPSLERVEHGVLIDDHLALESITGLSQISQVSHSLVVRANRRLKSLAGLEALVDAGSEGLTLDDNHDLVDLKALASLQKSGKSLVISNHFSLPEIKGFSELTEANALHLLNNRSITDINGFSKLNQITEVRIEGNGKLQRVHGFAQIKSLVDLKVKDNTALAKFAGFGNCASTGHLDITDNPGLTELKLSLLQQTGTLTLHRNQSLGTFAGLFPLKYIDIFSVCDNPNLPTAKVETFLKQLWKQPQKVDTCDG